MCEFDNVDGYRHPLNDGIMRVSDAMIGGKCELVCGHGDVGNDCTFAAQVVPENVHTREHAVTRAHEYFLT